VQWPISEIEKLREKPVHLPQQVLKGGLALEVSGVTAAQVLLFFWHFSNGQILAHVIVVVQVNLNPIACYLFVLFTMLKSDNILYSWFTGRCCDFIQNKWIGESRSIGPKLDQSTSPL
jgi:hypothetical protein